MKNALLAENFDFQNNIPLWQLDSERKMISQHFVFENFKQAFEFMTLCAQYAEEIDHHPDWSNSWNKVMVQLTTHSFNGLSELDIAMAKAMDTFALKLKS
jgi:4a-hydroxytetrahydrobiopterin dehydratase